MKHDDIFERLEPPPGGLTALRARMEPRSSWRFAPLAFAAVAVASLALMWTTSQGRSVDLLTAAREQADGAAVGLGLARPPLDAVAISDETRATTALAKVSTTNPNVAFYWISSTAWQD